MSNLRNVVYLTETQLEELRTNGAVTVNGTTIEYSDSDLYITPLDDFDGIYATEADLTAVESSVLDNSERITVIEHEGGTVVQGQGRIQNSDLENGYIKVDVPGDIRKNLSFFWIANIMFMTDSEQGCYMGMCRGVLDNGGSESAVFVAPSGFLLAMNPGEAVIPQSMSFGGSGDTFLTLPLISANTVGDYYAYKIEFIY